MKNALVLGAGGMDGSYLCDILLSRGYKVHALVRHSSVDNLKRIRHLLQPSLEGVTPITLHHGDVTDLLSLRQAITLSNPDEIYNMADQDNVGWSFSNKLYQIDVTYKAVAGLLELTRILNGPLFPEDGEHIKLFQPVSATMFGMAPPCQDENTPLDPRSPYAVAKAAVYYLCRHYRQEHGLYVNCGIMFNHDSPRRAEGYLLGKICKGAIDIANGKLDKLTLSNLQLIVDIGYARDYMEAVVDMMQLEKSDDYCIGTGENWTIRRMLNSAFHHAGLNDRSVTGNVRETGERSFPRQKQPILVADCSKACDAFNFTPKTGIDDLIKMLIDHHKEQR